jgi:hypothetical protein
MSDHADKDSTDRLARLRELTAIPITPDAATESRGIPVEKVKQFIEDEARERFQSARSEGQG